MPVPHTPIQERPCETCGEPILVKWLPNGKRLSPAQYARYRFCGRSCANAAARVSVDPDAQDDYRPNGKSIWDNTERMPNGCLEWRGAVKGGGYGNITYHQRPWYAHRLAWTITYGPIPDGLLVCHRCDNRLCVEPTHLFLGTVQENLADAKAKGRLRGPHKLDP
jgi:hypothetical protein